MRKEKGITMVSVVIYIVLMTMVIGAMSSIITNFYKNTDTVQGNVQEVVEFSKFNNYFLKEVKTNNNKVEKLANDNTYILFASGNAFSIVDDKIYYNNIKICDKVQSMKISLGKNGDGLDESIINVTLNFKNFNKSINYKVENIY